MPPLPPLILASTSTIRRDLISQLNVPFATVAPDYVERDLGLAPREEAQERARGKAQSVAHRHPEATIVASDQLLVVGERKLPKPPDDGAVARLLKFMRGVEHRLYTALVVHMPGGHPAFEDVIVSRLVIHADLTDEEIRAYVAADHPAGCAGGYKLESRGICLFSSIDTPDFTAILGLPMLSLWRALRSMGYRGA